MAVVQATSTVSAQARTVRAATTWSPPTGLTHTRPWRSSPLAFSTLPPIISESSEESYEDDFPAPRNRRAFGQTQRSPSSSSIVSDSPAASLSGCGSRNASGSGSALVLVQGDGSTSSISLHASSSAHCTPTVSSSHGHGNSQTHSNRSPRLSKSPGRRPSSAQERLSPKNVSEMMSITLPPRARTVSHGHSRSALYPAHPFVPSPSIPPTYSRSSPRPTSPEFDPNTTKQPPSTSRDPSSNWMSSSPFGPASVPKFSRLAMASPAVVMPLSAKEYRKRKAKDPVGNGKEKEPPTSSNHVTFSDTAHPALQPIPNGVPQVKVSPPPSGDVHEPRSPPSSSGDHSLDHQTQPQPQLDHPPPKPFPHASLYPQPQPKPRPSAPKQKRPRSRPNTPPRSSPLAAHPPISPKSSTGTFFSLASVSDDDTAPPFPSSHPQGTDDPNGINAVPPARPRLRPRRRKSYPDRLSNGARLSLLEAMNRLSQESTTLHRLSGLSQTEGANRLSVASQASGHTLFYDVVESEEEVGHENGNGDRCNGGGGGGQRTSILTQSLEDLSSTLARTGIEVVHPDGDGDPGAPLDDERKGKRNVRMVRISDTVEVSPAPVPRRRKLTKSRPGSAHGTAPAPGAGAGAGSAPVTGTGTGTIKEKTKVQTHTRTQTQERRTSLLPWKSKGSGDPSKGGAVGAGDKSGEDGQPSTPTRKGLVHTNGSASPHPVSPIANGSTLSAPGSTSPTKKPSSDTPTSTPTSTPSTTPRKSRRYTFSFLPTPTFHRHKREKSNTAPAGTDFGSDQHAAKGKPKEGGAKSVESGTDSTSTSIRTITQGSQSTLTHASPALYDLTTPASSGALPLAGRGTGSSAVPMLRRLNAQAMVTPGAPSLESAEWDGGGGGDSTPSLITNGSTATSSSVPRTLPLPSFVRLPGGGGEPFVPRSSALKEIFSDTSEEEEGMHGEGMEKERERMPKVCVHRRQDQRPAARGSVHIVGGAETEEDERAQLRGRSSSGLSLSASPRPGTSSSTLTTATETSGSYISFSTVPASTTSSSSSRSESPSLMMNDKQDVGGDGDGDVYACALCGHLVSGPTSPPPPSSQVVTREPDQLETHPMFTVPLVTVPASAMSSAGTYPRSMLVSSSNAPRAGMSGGRDARYVSGRKTEKHLSVPVPAAVGVGVSPAKSSHDHGYVYDQTQNHMHAHANGGYVPATTTRVTMMPSSASSPHSPPKVGKRRRPQTAPPGTGDAALKFMEDAKAMRAREGSVDVVHVGGDRATKHKGGSGESKFKTVLKGLLRWHG